MSQDRHEIEGTDSRGGILELPSRTGLGWAADPSIVGLGDLVFREGHRSSTLTVVLFRPSGAYSHCPYDELQRHWERTWNLVETLARQLIIPKFEHEVGAPQDFEQHRRDIKIRIPTFLEAIARTQTFPLGIAFAQDLRQGATGTGNWCPSTGQARGKGDVAPHSVDLEK